MEGPRYVFLFLTALSLVGCATPYQPKGFKGGFSETQLSENVFRVYFRGNGYTKEERAEDFTMLRSAELAEEHGFQYFVVVDENSISSVTGSVVMPTQTTTTASATGVGNTAYGTAYSTTTGGHSFFIKKPSDRMTIVCFKDRPDVQGVVYESSYIIESITTKYGMQH
jgi:hypothetical protein